MHAVALMLFAPSLAQAECSIDRVETLAMLPGRHIILPAAINDKPVHMELDTGAEMTTITPAASTALALNLDTGHRVVSRGLGGSTSSPNTFAETLTLGKSTYLEMSLATVSLPLGTDAEGAMIAGTVGADILSQYDVEFDLADGHVNFYEIRGCSQVRPPWQDGFDSVAAEIDRRHAVRFPIQVNGHTLIAQFDTGAMRETMSRDAAERIGVSPEELSTDPVVMGSGAGARSFEIRRHRFQSWEVAGELMHLPVFDVVEARLGQTDVLVGLDYMRRRKFYLSYSTKVLFVDHSGPSKPDPCQPGQELQPTLAHASPMRTGVVEDTQRARASVPHPEGCASILYHVSAEGIPIDMQVVSELPSGFGFAETAMHELARTRFRPSTEPTGWFCWEGQFKEEGTVTR